MAHRCCAKYILYSTRDITSPKWISRVRCRSGKSFPQIYKKSYLAILFVECRFDGGRAALSPKGERKCEFRGFSAFEMNRDLTPFSCPPFLLPPSRHRFMRMVTLPSAPAASPRGILQLFIRRHSLLRLSKTRLSMSNRRAWCAHGNTPEFQRWA